MRALSTIPVGQKPAGGSITKRSRAERSLPDIKSVARRVRGCQVAETPQFGEEWVTKRQLAGHLKVTPRWIELQQPLGLPVLRLGAANRYKISEVEAWLREHYPSTSVPRSA
jgi:hypothetical protein